METKIAFINWAFLLLIVTITTTAVHCVLKYNVYVYDEFTCKIMLFSCFPVNKPSFPHWYTFDFYHKRWS
jgi:hypothetical protein